MAQHHESGRMSHGNFPLRFGRCTKYFNAAGFTLVELAVVLMIIGLLIGGILRGQELYNNAKITSTIQQIKAYDGASVSFLGMYNGLPGDIINPGNRIPNCSAAPCNTPGDGNGIIGPIAAGAGFDYIGAVENNIYFIQLTTAHLVSGGVNSSNKWTAGATQSATYPPVPMGAFMWVGYYNIPTGNANWPNGVNGHWYVLLTRSSDGTKLNNQAIAVNRLAQLDQKIDDGLPFTGQAVLNNTACGVTGNVYDANNVNLCSFQIRTAF